MALQSGRRRALGALHQRDNLSLLSSSAKKGLAGKLGATARNKNLTPEQRTELAKKAGGSEP